MAAIKTDSGAYKELKDQLDRTAVISNPFRDMILLFTQKAMQEAYQRGQSEKVEL